MSRHGLPHGEGHAFRHIGDQKTTLTGTPGRWETDVPGLASLET